MSSFTRDELEAFAAACRGVTPEFFTGATPPDDTAMPVVRGCTDDGIWLWMAKTPQGMLRGMSKTMPEFGGLPSQTT